MDIPHYETAVIVGAGEGISASLTRLLARQGLRVALAARNTAKLAALCEETGAKAFACDATNAAEVARLFVDAEQQIGQLDVAVYNASLRARGAFVELKPDDVAQSIAVSAFDGFLVAQQALQRMLPRQHGALLFTGASASIKGFAQSAPFAMGKFALRGMAQSLAREFAPQGIHVAHFVIDGGIRSSVRPVPADRPDSLLDRNATARATSCGSTRRPKGCFAAASASQSGLRPWNSRWMRSSPSVAIQPIFRPLTRMRLRSSA